MIPAPPSSQPRGLTGFGRIFIALIVLLAIALAFLIRIGPGRDGVQPAEPAPTAVAAGDLVVPVAGVRPDQLVDTFGDPRGGGTRGHGALDIMAARGTPVLAAAAGTIEKIFESAEGGHTLYVRTADGRLIHYYAHLDSYAAGIAEGVHVDRGQRIASVGFTGNASPEGPHLHFAIKRMASGQHWYEGTPIDPYPLLAGKAVSG